jgi:hypothetical protein
MGVIFENCHGSVHAIGKSGAGFYALSPSIPDGSGSKALIMGVTLEFQEIVQPVTTLDDKRLLYVFGTAWNDVSAVGLMLLGDSSTRGAQVAALLGWYNANRVSQKKGPIGVSMGTSNLDAYVVGLSLGQANATNNTQPFVVRMVTTDVK